MIKIAIPRHDGTQIEIAEGTRISWVDAFGFGGVTLCATVTGFEARGGHLHVLALETDPNEQLVALADQMALPPARSRDVLTGHGGRVVVTGDGFCRAVYDGSVTLLEPDAAAAFALRALRLTTLSQAATVLREMALANTATPPLYRYRQETSDKWKNSDEWRALAGMRRPAPGFYGGPPPPPPPARPIDWNALRQAPGIMESFGNDIMRRVAENAKRTPPPEDPYQAQRLAEFQREAGASGAAVFHERAPTGATHRLSRYQALAREPRPGRMRIRLRLPSPVQTIAEAYGPAREADVKPGEAPPVTEHVGPTPEALAQQRRRDRGRGPLHFGAQWKRNPYPGEWVFPSPEAKAAWLASGGSDDCPDQFDDDDVDDDDVDDEEPPPTIKSRIDQTTARARAASWAPWAGWVLP